MPRLWTQKDKWTQTRKKEGIWKDIVVYDAVDLSQWLDNSSAVVIWFAVHLGNLSSDGVFNADQFWSEWSEGPHCILMSQTITAEEKLKYIIF